MKLYDLFKRKSALRDLALDIFGVDLERPIFVDASELWDRVANSSVSWRQYAPAEIKRRMNLICLRSWVDKRRKIYVWDPEFYECLRKSGKYPSSEAVDACYAIIRKWEKKLNAVFFTVYLPKEDRK